MGRVVKIYRSDSGGKYRHPELIVAINDDLNMDVNFLFEYLASEVRRGVRFGAGQTVQVGWMILMLKANRQGGLELWQPDFQSMSIERVFSLNRTMWHFHTERGLRADWCRGRLSVALAVRLCIAGLSVRSRIQHESRVDERCGFRLAVREI